MTTSAAQIIINRARTMKPSARVKLLGEHPVSDLVDIHAALIEAPKPRTPRPVLEKRILAALAKPEPAAEPEVPAVAPAAAVETPAGDPAPEAPAPAEDATAAHTDASPAEGSRLPAIGTVIVKSDRHGKERVRCTVVADGILYGGKTHKTLSGAAVAAARDLGLTTKTLNGFTWWGVASKGKRAPKLADPTAAIAKAWDRYQAATRAALEGASPEAKAQVREVLGAHRAALRELAHAAA